MRKEARLFLESSTSSLILATELFNRPSDVGRTNSVLILLDHAFELVLKAAILQRGGRIREKRERFAIGFEKALGKCLDDAEVKFLAREEALTLQAINGLRDQAQHFFAVVPEQVLYAMVRSGVTLYGQLLDRVFGINLTDRLPSRVLPISADPPKGLDLLVKDELKLIRDLLKPGTRRGLEARARLRSLAVIDRAVTGEVEGQPTDSDVRHYAARVRDGEQWTRIFPGMAGLSFVSNGDGPSLSLRITKKEGIPIQLVGEGDSTAAAVAVKRVDETGYYNLSFNQLAEKLADVITRNRLSALIWHLKIKENSKYSRVFRFGKTSFQMYAEPLLGYLKEQLKMTDIGAVWNAFRTRNR